MIFIWSEKCLNENTCCVYTTVTYSGIMGNVICLSVNHLWCFAFPCPQACRLLSDDYEQVRSAAVQMVWVLSQLYPERWEDTVVCRQCAAIVVQFYLKKTKHAALSLCSDQFLPPISIVPIPSSNEEIRLVDDAFGKISHMVSDGSWMVRVQAGKTLVREAK